MRVPAFPLLAILLAPLSCASAPPAPPPTPAPPPPAPPVARLPAEPVPTGPLPRDAHPTHERLALTLDPESDRFEGTASIDVTLDRPRDVVWLHGRGLTVASCDVALASGEHVPATWSDADPAGVARVSLARPVTGAATITLRYAAPYDGTLVGVYRTAQADGTHAVFSKFEAIYARRAFPCFDEPSFKIPFDVTLTVPKGEVALGNMPVASTSEADGKQTVTFATTPPLPTYLVAFAVGPFESRAASLPANPLREAVLPIDAVALRGRGAETELAATLAPALLAEEERYYGIRFPFPKLDLLAVPEFQSGAMENAGLITFADTYLLVDPKASSLGQRIGVADVIAHEQAHQWFGDLVTMRWWDDLWLNESFASFLATRAVQAVKPEFDVDLQEIANTNNVMNADGLASTRRIRQPIASTDDITNAFDGITYEKGEAILAMVERYVGAAPFQRGLHEYLEAHAGGNATTHDLVDALSKSAGRDLAPLFASFLDQPGAPLIAVHATCDHGKGALALEQSRWLPYGSTASKDETWTVPVCARAGVGGKAVEACTLLTGRTGTIDLPGCADWAMPDEGASGYYRFTEPPAELGRLRDQGVKHLTTGERMALAGDLDAAFHSASLSSGDVLQAMEPLARDPHGTVATTPLALLRFIDDRLLDDATRAPFRAWIRRLYAPAMASLGWRGKPGEPTNRVFERRGLLDFLARSMGDPAALSEGARLGRAYLGIGGDGALHPDAVDPDLAGIALAAAVREGDKDGKPAVFDAVLAALKQSNDGTKRRLFLAALANTRAPALVTRALDLALDPALRKNERLLTLRPLLGSSATRAMAWGWLTAHFDPLAAMLPDRYGGGVAPMVGFCDAQKADEVKAFFTPRVPNLTGGTRNLAQAVEAMTACAALAGAQRASAVAFVQRLRPH